MQRTLWGFGRGMRLEEIGGAEVEAIAYMLLIPSRDGVNRFLGKLPVYTLLRSQIFGCGLYLRTQRAPAWTYALKADEIE